MYTKYDITIKHLDPIQHTVEFELESGYVKSLLSKAGLPLRLAAKELDFSGYTFLSITYAEEGYKFHPGTYIPAYVDGPIEKCHPAEGEPSSIVYKRIIAVVGPYYVDVTSSFRSTWYANLLEQYILNIEERNYHGY